MFSATAFSSTAFATGASGPVPYSVTLPIDVDVADARVFDTSVGTVTWSLIVIAGAYDISARLVGDVTIEAAEDAARLATLALIPASVDQFAALDSAAITIDVVIFGGGYSARRRRFTGVVERVDFSPATRVATLTCRCGWQERIKACRSAQEVRSLLGGLATVSDLVAQWNDDEPDAWSYFQDALATMPGATFIDGAGVWRAVRWEIDTPALVYTAADMFDPGPTLERASRADTPSAIVATLTHTFHRLHAAALLLLWADLPYYDHEGPSGIAVRRPTRDEWQAALDGLSDWYVASATFKYFNYLQYGSEPPAAELSATMYRRWYQQVVRRYTVTIDMGGTSDRDESISRSIESDFDAGQWESGAGGDAAVEIYAANPPVGTPPPTPLGIAALPAPHPPSNGALDHFGIDDPDIHNAIAHVVAEATRSAAQGRRRQRVTFSRPADLRLEIGVVAGVDAYGLAGVGQLASWSETYSIEGGACVGEYIFACPDGNATETGSTAHVTLPAVDVVHALTPPNLTTWVGASTTTPSYYIDPATISGALSNTDSTSAGFDATKPFYEEQVRIVMPEIPATVRDPAEEEVAVSAIVSIAGSGVSISF